MRIHWEIRRYVLPWLVALLAAGCGASPGEQVNQHQDVVAPPEAIALTGSHLLIQRGGFDLGKPAAARLGNTVAVAYQQRELPGAGLKLGLAVATTTDDDSPGVFVARDIQTARATTVTRLQPHLAARSDGFWLAWTEHEDDQESYPKPGALYRARLNADGSLADGPHLEPLGPCLEVSIASSGDRLLMVCRYEDEEHSRLSYAVAPASGAASSPMTVSTADPDGLFRPAVVWDDAAFDLLYIALDTIDATVHGELRLSRISEDGAQFGSEVVIEAADDSRYGFTPLVAATWNGSAIAMVWTLDTQGNRDRFATLTPDGTFVQPPVPLEVGFLGLGYLPTMAQLVPLEAGYALLASYGQVVPDPAVCESAQAICALDQQGVLQEPCDWVTNLRTVDCMPVDLAPVPRSGGLTIFYDEALYTSWIEGVYPRRAAKSSIFHLPWAAPGTFEAEPAALLPPAGDLRPIALGCSETACLIGTAWPQSQALQDIEDWDAKVPVHLFTVDLAEQTVEDHATGIEIPEYPPTVLTAGHSPARVALVWFDHISDWPVLTVLGADGEVLWAHNLTALSVQGIHHLFAEGDELRVFYYESSLSGTAQLVVSSEQVGPSQPVSEVFLRQMVHAAGAYIGYQEYDDQQQLQRFDPLESSGFDPLVELEVLASGRTLFGAAEFIATLQWDETEGLLQRWLPDGTPGLDARLLWTGEPPGTAGVQLGAELGILLHDLVTGALPAYLWRVRPVGSSTLYELDLPAGTTGFILPQVQGSSAQLSAAWRDPGTGDVFLSSWPLQ